MSQKGRGKEKKSEVRKLTKEILVDATEGLLSTVGEIILAELFFGLSLLVAGSYSGSVYRASREADRMLEEIKSSTVKKTCHKLKQEGLITYVKGRNTAANAKLTKVGLERVREILPKYRKERPWDGRLYFITYDVPESRRRDREVLRQLLRKISCGPLQQSVWVTPYNPKGFLEEIVREFGIIGDIIVSDTGKEGSIGKTDFKELMRRVHNLGKINDQYAEYIEMCKTGDFKMREQAIFKFLSIVGNDPQLPYELLPEDWLGNKAHSFYEKFI